ncbi:MAG TPA: hypothetical protein VN684_08425 [Terriglobales bacterium]|jgi:hypothetical protein|nr:hypothetical protein [Terriglobales bacterium]
MTVNGHPKSHEDNPARVASSEILTVSEIAARLRVPTSWVYGHADLIGVLRVGKYLRFHWPRVLERLGNPEFHSSPLGSQPNDFMEKS